MVRKLAVTENITLDGVIDTSEGCSRPGGPGLDQSDIKAVPRSGRGSRRLPAGRVTFEQFRGYWPKQVDDRPAWRST